MLIKGREWRNLLADGAIVWPEFEGEIGAVEMKAIDEANRLAPCCKGMLMDPYFRALDDVIDLGLIVWWNGPNGRVKRDKEKYFTASRRG